MWGETHVSTAFMVTVRGGTTDEGKKVERSPKLSAPSLKPREPPYACQCGAMPNAPMNLYAFQMHSTLTTAPVSQGWPIHLTVMVIAVRSVMHIRP